MSLFSKSETNISGNKGSTIVVGTSNIVSVSQKLSELYEQNIVSQAGDWEKVIEQITFLQDIVKDLDNSHEELRDQILIPTLSKAKKEARTLTENPSSNKKSFIDNFKSFCDAALKATDVATRVAPFVTMIAKLIGIPMP